MKIRLTLLLLFCCLNSATLLAQTSTDVLKLKNEVENLSKETNALKVVQQQNADKIKSLESLVSSQEVMIDSLKTRSERNDIAINNTTTELKKDIDITNNSLKTSSKVMATQINLKSLFAGIIGLIAAILAVIFFILHRKTSYRNAVAISDFETELAKIKKEQDDLENGLTVNNSKILDVIEKQMSLIDKIPSATHADDADHSLAIAVANELTRIQQNLDYMDDKVKGVSQLRNRAKAILMTLNSKRYEIPDLLGREYHEGDNIIATMELNEELKPGTNRIKRIIKPQVSYASKVIQQAEVVVEYNE
jgi:hypothetical protein